MLIIKYSNIFLNFGFIFPVTFVSNDSINHPSTIEFAKCRIMSIGIRVFGVSTIIVSFSPPQFMSLVIRERLYSDYGRVAATGRVATMYVPRPVVSRPRTI